MPALTTPVSDADQVLNKVATTLNRAGSNSRNPILSGLGVQVQIPLALADRIQGVHLYQDPADLGANLLDQVSVFAPGIYELHFLAGAGRTVAGDAEHGAARNFLRVESKFGAFEREFWIKTFESDAVVLDGQAALDPATMDPVTIQVNALGEGVDWIPVPVDWFVSWNDELQKLHVGENAALNPGFLKAYGGATLVSVFDTDPGDEDVHGNSVQVHQFRQQPIENRHVVEVQNTAGEKWFTCRFRSKLDSTYYVDVPCCVEVVPAIACSCYPPVAGLCADVLFLRNTRVPVNTPYRASVPGTPTGAGGYFTRFTEDLLVVVLKGWSIGADPTVIVRKWAPVPSEFMLGGVQFQQVGDDVELIPLVRDGTIDNPPWPGDPYPAEGHMYAVAFSVVALRADNIAALEVMLKDGTMTSRPALSAGPMLRSIGFFPPGGAGGGPGCCTAERCVADLESGYGYGY